jgi:predicted MFS family arabinose efflux permease
VQPQPLTRLQVLIFAATCGASVANLYYAQPLLDTIAGELGTSETAAGILVTAGQIGYALGLVFVVPLGDLVDRRHMIVRMLLISAVALAGCAAAPDLAVLALGIVVASVTAVVAQLLVPLAGDVTPERDRGRVVGVVMSGLLIGILASRVVSGLIADLAGWRTVYGVAAGIAIVFALILHRTLPDVPRRTASTYGQLLRSVLTIVREEPVLRYRMVFGALGMTTFISFWTALTYLLVRAPFDYSEGQIGLLGVAGLAGAMSAQGAGRLADRGHARLATGAFWLMIGAGWVVAEIGASSIVVLIIGIVLLDAGVQAQHITNQTIIYGLRPDARSRITTAYMTFNFVFGALSSVFVGAIWTAGGWDAVCAYGIGTAVLALIVWAVGVRRTAAVPAAQET